MLVRVARSVPGIQTHERAGKFRSMSLITAANLAKSYGPDDIFSGVSFAIPKGARLAIVGPNGIGKTTLLRILYGEETASEGKVNRAKALRMGYLPQEAASDTAFESDASLWAVCLDSFADLRQMETEQARLETLMSDPLQAETALARYGPLQAEFEQCGGYTYLTRIRQVLTGLGFTPEEFDYPLCHLSGGQRTRALLARLLLVDPDVLILDEPTNHLDIAAVEWLEDYLTRWEGAALIVSHDRYFLDRVATTILEMSRVGFETYHGNYSAYVQDRQRRWDLRMQIFETEKIRLEKELEYIRRNISGQNVQQAKGRLRRLTRYLQAVEQIGLEHVVGRSWGQVAEQVSTTVSSFSVDEASRRVRSLRPPSNRPPGLSLHLHASYRSGDIVLRTKNITVGYPGKVLFRAEDIELRRLETAALIGPNGAGKTTFINVLTGLFPPTDGRIIYEGKDISALPAHIRSRMGITRTFQISRPLVDLTLLENVMTGALFARGLTRPQAIKKASDVCGFMGLHDLDKPVSKLTALEIKKMEVARALSTDPKILMLDELMAGISSDEADEMMDLIKKIRGQGISLCVIEHVMRIIAALTDRVIVLDWGRKLAEGLYSEVSHNPMVIEAYLGEDA